MAEHIHDYVCMRKRKREDKLWSLINVANNVIFLNALCVHVHMYDFEVQIPVTSHHHCMNIINIISNYRQSSLTKKVGTNLWTITEPNKRHWHRCIWLYKEKLFYFLNSGHRRNHFYYLHETINVNVHLSSNSN